MQRESVRDRDEESDARPSVSAIARTFDEASPAASDSREKRARAVSGESTTPVSKKVLMSRTTPARDDISVEMSTALERFESRMMAVISEEVHSLRVSVQAQLERLADRVKDLEDHVNEKDIEAEKMEKELAEVKEEVKRMKVRAEKAEMNSRIPCLIFSGRAMAPQRSPRLGAPLPPARSRVMTSGDLAGSADRDPPQAGVTGSSNARDGERDVRGPGGGRQNGRGASGGDRGGEWEPEDINGLVINAVRARLPGLNFTEADIDRAHRLPGPNHRVIVKFVRSGSGSVRESLMLRRTELREYRDLYINESLTAEKQRIFGCLLDAKKQKKIHTVFSRWGHVYCKEKRFGVSTRIDTLEKVREMGFPLRE